MMSKADLRRSICTQLAGIGDIRSEWSREICCWLVAEEIWKSASTIALFAPQLREPDIELLWSHGKGKEFCFPRVLGTELEFRAVEDPKALVTRRWELREPDPETSLPVALEEIDLLLVPGVAFTRSGRRLGRGGGFYDRLLADPELCAVSFGICFALQVVDNLPTEPHDRPVDRIVTERGPASS